MTIRRGGLLGDVGVVVTLGRLQIGQVAATGTTHRARTRGEMESRPSYVGGYLLTSSVLYVYVCVACVCCACMCVGR